MRGNSSGGGNFLTVGPVSADGYNYYCPKGNVSFTGSKGGISGRAMSPFLSARDLATSAARYSKLLSFQIKDCSDSKYLCMDMSDTDRNFSHRLFVPRTISVGATYQYGGSTAYVVPSTAADHKATVQVIDSEMVGGRLVSMKLTIRDGRGAIFLDGVNFWNPDDYISGETCVLESDEGFFAAARVMPVPSHRPIND